jgi:predicted metal-dependent hydrolase
MKINVTHQREEAIKQSPLQNSSMAIKITYMKSDYRLEESLISMEKLQEMIGTSRITGSINEHEKLVFRNNSLAGQVEQLKQANEALQKEHRTLQNSMKEKSKEFREEMELIEQTRM